MCDGLHLVIDEDLRSHHDEPERVNTSRKSGENPRIPTSEKFSTKNKNLTTASPFVSFINESVYGIKEYERIENV